MNIRFLHSAVLAALFLTALPRTVAGPYPDNEDGPYGDMLTPAYYTQADTGTFRAAVNEFVHYVRLVPYGHPLADSAGTMPAYTIGKDFGDGTGPGDTAAHHPAVDMHPGGATLVDLYAAHAGTVRTGRDIARYRQYITITTDVMDSTNAVIGKLVTLYGHVDLDLDTAAGLFMDGRYVRKGERVSAHLYAGTVGGPHLHCETRYYRAADTGSEDFYGGLTVDKTVPSAGTWPYGYWNPDAGYGFGNPLNHFDTGSAGLRDRSSGVPVRLEVRRTGNALRISFPPAPRNGLLLVTDTAGHGIYRRSLAPNDTSVTIPAGTYPAGAYVLCLYGYENRMMGKIVIY